MVKEILPITELFIVEITIGDIIDDIKKRQVEYLKKFLASQGNLVDTAFNSVLQKEIVEKELLVKLRESLST